MDIGGVELVVWIGQQRQYHLLLISVRFGLFLGSGIVLGRCLIVVPNAVLSQLSVIIVCATSSLLITSDKCFFLIPLMTVIHSFSLSL